MCDTPVASLTRYPRARVPHECCECHETIQPGQKYELFSGVWEGRGQSFKTCLTCAAVRSEFGGMLAPGDCWPVFGALWEECTDYGNVPREAWLKEVS